MTYISSKKVVPENLIYAHHFVIFSVFLNV